MMTTTHPAPTPSPVEAEPAITPANTANVNTPRRIIDIVKYRGLYLTISAVMIIPGLVFMGLNMMKQPSHSPVKPGIDFVGGTLTDVQVGRKLTQGDLPAIRVALGNAGIEDAVLQLQEPITQEAVKPDESSKNNTQVAPLTGSVLSVRSPILQNEQNQALLNTLKNNIGEVRLLQRNTVGPTLANELLTNALLALGLAYLLITGYLTYRFQLDYAMCALLALVHDTAIVFGVFAMMGYLGNVAVDSLFITGILTVIGFSVHDTIVVFDRLRENSRIMYSQKLPFSEIANLSVNQTLARSINTSMTALLPLLTLYFFGGESTKNLVLCMALGIAVGTYSSIAIASLMLNWWRTRREKHISPATST